MDEKKTKLTEEIEDTLACSAFAEAGEPCPIGSKDDNATSEPSEKEKKSTSESIEDTMACSAFAEAGEPCPIDSEKEPGEESTEK